MKTRVVVTLYVFAIVIHVHSWWIEASLSLEPNVVCLLYTN